MGQVLITSGVGTPPPATAEVQPPAEPIPTASAAATVGVLPSITVGAVAPSTAASSVAALPHVAADAPVLATAAALPHGAAGAPTPSAARGPIESVEGEPKSFTPATLTTVIPAGQRARKAPLLPLDEAGSAIPTGAAAAMFSAARLGLSPSSATTGAGTLPGVPGGSPPRGARAAAPSLGVAGPPAPPTSRSSDQQRGSGTATDRAATGHVPRSLVVAAASSTAMAAPDPVDVPECAAAPTAIVAALPSGRQLHRQYVHHLEWPPTHRKMQISTL